MVVTVSATPRLATRSMVCRRNRTAASPQCSTGGLRINLSRNEAARPSASPIRRANSFFQSTSANSTTPPARTRTPTNEATTSPPLAWPWTARIASATTGRPSFMNTFQIPVTSADRAMTEVGKPHDRYIV